MSKLPKPGSGIPAPGLRRLGPPKSYNTSTPESPKVATDMDAILAGILAENPQLAGTINLSAFGPISTASPTPPPVQRRGSPPSDAVASPTSPTLKRASAAPVASKSTKNRTVSVSSRASTTSSYTDEPSSHSSRNSVSSNSSVGVPTTPRTPTGQPGGPKPVASSKSSSRASSGKGTPTTTPTSKRQSVVAPPLPVPTALAPVSKPAPTGEFKLGERVAVESMKIEGTLRYIGTTSFKSGMWAGIELDTPGGGKNDGTVAGVTYFQCPPKAGIFVLATNLSRPEVDSQPSTRPESSASTNSERPTLLMPGSSAHQAALAAARITAGSRASEYLGLTASQLTQKKLGRAGANGAIASLSASTARSMSPSVSPNKPGSRSPNTKVANRQSTSSTTSNGGNSGIASPQFGLRQPGPMAQSSSREKIGLSRRVSTSSNGSGISSPTPRGPAGELAYGGSNQRRLSSSTNSRPQTPSILPSPSTSEYKVMSAEALVAAASSAVDEEESFQAKLNRLAADNSAEGTDEATMRMHQMQLRVEVLEAENRFLKLENAQNKNAEKLFERNLLLRRGTGEENDGSLAAVEEVERLRKQFDESKERWQVERDALSDKVNALAREKEAAEGKARMAEEKVAIVEANAAAAVAMDRDRSGPDTRQMEEEMESVHEKVLNLTEVVRVKDRFLEDLTKQVMELRNEMEKKEREIRLAKADFEKEKKESAGLAVGGASTEELEKVRAELETTKKTAEKEKAEKMSELEKVIKEREAAEAAHKAKVAELDATVDDLKKDCMESLELHETTVEVHKANMEALRATLDDEKRKVKMLESECDELRKATVEAFGVCEVTIDELKKEMESQIEDKDAAIKRVRAEADGLKKEIEEMVKASQAGKDEEVEKIRAVWESEKKRLEERIEMGQKEVDKVKEERERIKAESERLKEEVKELDKLKNERTKLEERLKDTEKDYEEHLNARRRLTEDIKVANEEKQKAEGENRRMVEAKEKMERERERMDKELRDLKEKTEAAQAQASKEINEYKEKLEAAEQQAAKLQDQLQGPAAKAAEKTRTDLEAQIVTLKSQHFAQLEMLQDEIERLDAHSKMLVKQKEELALKLESNSRKSVDMVRSTSTSSSKAGRREKELESQIATYEEQVAGLKHLCDNIAKENEAIHAENKRLMGEYENLSEAHKQVESECLKLMDEVERLHAEGLLGLGAVPPVDAAAPGSEEAKEGEDETSAATAAAAAAGSSSVLPASVAGEVAKLQVQLAEKQAQLDKLGMQHASELREVRQRYSELERTKQREIHALTKDVAELESLVESKIFKEADLEEMLESERKQIRRLREDVQELKQQVKELSDGAVFGSVASRQKSGSRSAADIKGSSSSNGSSRRHSDINEEDEDEDEDEDKPYCELCEESGHDIISCTAVLNGAGGRANGIARNTATTIKVARDEDERPFCDNCEEFGLHWTEACPNQDETF